MSQHIRSPSENDPPGSESLAEIIMEAEKYGSREGHFSGATRNSDAKQNSGAKQNSDAKFKNNTSVNSLF